MIDLGARGLASSRDTILTYEDLAYDVWERNFQKLDKFKKAGDGAHNSKIFESDSHLVDRFRK